MSCLLYFSVCFLASVKVRSSTDRIFLNLNYINERLALEYDVVRYKLNVGQGGLYRVSELKRASTVRSRI
jgi:hypothetical protein